jgi:hypothetical protein
MKRTLFSTAGNAIIVAIVIAALAPFLIMAVRKLTVDTSSKLVDSFVEIPNATK